jgi:hypothetical protein
MATTESAPKTAVLTSSEISDIVDQLMNNTAPNEVRLGDGQAVQDNFASLGVDEKLAVLYFIYKAMGNSVTPAALGAANTDLLHTFFAEFDALPNNDEAQLEAQRAIVRGDDTSLSRQYSSQSENNKLAIWYLIAQRMGSNVIDVPGDYKLSDVGQNSLTAIQNLDFEYQITFLRYAAEQMGKHSV